MSNSSTITDEYTQSSSPRRSPRKSTKFRKSKTPPSRKSTCSSSSDGDSSEDDFPNYRANWMEKSPSNSRVQSRRMYDDLKDLDDMLADAREIIRNILRK